jgi:hypothetical protein
MHHWIVVVVVSRTQHEGPPDPLRSKPGCWTAPSLRMPAVALDGRAVGAGQVSVTPLTKCANDRVEFATGRCQLIGVPGSGVVWRIGVCSKA